MFLLSPIFSFPFYIHSPKEYHNLRDKLEEKIKAGITPPENLDFFIKRGFISERIENKYPLLWRYNDLAGFISIRIENPIECYRVIAEAWGIKNRRIISQKRFNHICTCTEYMYRNMINEPSKFNVEFFEKVKILFDKIKNNHLTPKKFYFPLEDSLLHFDLIKSCNVAEFIIDVEKNYTKGA